MTATSYLIEIAPPDRKRGLYGSCSSPARIGFADGGHRWRCADAEPEPGTACRPGAGARAFVLDCC